MQSVAMACATCPRRKKAGPKPRPRSSGALAATPDDRQLRDCPFLEGMDSKAQAE